MLAVGELPRRRQVGVGGGDERGARLGGQRVEVGRQLFGVLEVISGHLAVVRFRLGVVKMKVPDFGSVATCLANLPMGMDFSWACSRGLSSGMRSSVRRVIPISMSMSCSKSSAVVIWGLLSFLDRILDSRNSNLDSGNVGAAIDEGGRR